MYREKVVRVLVLCCGDIQQALEMLAKGVIQHTSLLPEDSTAGHTVQGRYKIPFFLSELCHWGV